MLPISPYVFISLLPNLYYSFSNLTFHTNWSITNLSPNCFATSYFHSMLSRGSSNAGNRLRRAKSSSSTAVKPLPSQTPPLDPAVARQYAEAAAAKAFERARESKNSNISHTNRNKSRLVRQSQGSHLQSSLAVSSPNQDGRQLHGQNSNKETAPKQNPGATSNTISRAESFLDTHSQLEARHTAEENHASEPSSFRRLRKTRSLHVANERQQTARTMESPENEQTTDNRRNKNIRGRSMVSLPPPQPEDIPCLTNGNKATNDGPEREIVARARDKIFQQLHNRRLRESTSFMAFSRTVMKRKDDQRSSSGQKSGISYGDQLSSPVKGQKPSRSTPRLREKARTLSAPLTSSFKRLLRKSSTGSEIPDQQREATKLYFEPPDPQLDVPFAHGSQIDIRDLQTPIETPQVSTVQVLQNDTNASSRGYSQNSGCSDTASSMTRSRVTSWSDSTAADTVGTAISQRLPVIDEQGGIPDPASFYESRPSPMGMKNIIKRQGSSTSEKSRKRHSSTSKRIYSALMKKIEPANSASKEASLGSPTKSPEQKSALDSLPSRRHSSRLSRLSRLSKGTIRTVTPDTCTRIENRLPSDAARTLALIGNEALSDKGSSSRTQRVSMPTTAPDDSATPTRDGHVHTRLGHSSLVMSTSSPTQDLLEKRAERAKNRWKTTLEPGRSSPFFSSRAAKWSLDENPYELRPNHQTFSPQSKHIEDGQRNPDESNRARLMRSIASPSVYSRDTDGHSKEQLSPGSRQSGSETTIVITSHDIQDFPINSPQSSTVHRTLTSESNYDWKTWLTHELSDMSFSEEDLSFSAANQNGSVPGSTSQPDKMLPYDPLGHRRELAEIVTHEENNSDQIRADNTIRAKDFQARRQRKHRIARDDSNNHESHDGPGNDMSHSHPRLPRQTSSQMNDRFPMLFAGRSPSSADLCDILKPSPQSRASTSSSPASRSRIPKPTSSGTLEYRPSPLRQSATDMRNLQESASFVKSAIPEPKPQNTTESMPVLPPPGKENTPSSPSKAARISATPASSPHSIRSRRVRPSPRMAEHGEEKMTTSMLNAWLEGRQGEGQREKGRDVSYAFL